MLPTIIHCLPPTGNYICVLCNKFDYKFNTLKLQIIERPEMDEEIQKAMFAAMLNYQQMLSAAAAQPQTNNANSGGSATSNGSNSGAASPPGSIASNSPTPDQNALNGSVPSSLLQLPKFCQDLLQQSANGQPNGLSFLSNGPEPTTPMSNPLAALFGANANSALGQPTSEQVCRFREFSRYLEST